MKIFKFVLLMFACVMQETILAASVAAPQEGEASYYAYSLNGRKTASGDIYDKNALSAAHCSLPFGTRVRVTHLKNG
jgi:rare lipoprotein A